MERFAGWRAHLWLVVAAIAWSAASCGQGTENPEANHEARMLDPTLRAVASRIPALEPLLRRALPLRERHGRFELASAARDKPTRPHVLVTVPYEDGSRFEVGTSHQPGRLSVTRLGDAPWSVRAHDRHILIESADGLISSVWFATEAGVEELLRVRRPGALLAYRLRMSEGVRARPLGRKRIRLTMHEAPWLSVAAPAAWDAQGDRIETWLSLEGSTLYVEWARGAEHPVWIDPSWETEVMAPAKVSAHTATLLLDGTVLVVGASVDEPVAFRYAPFLGDVTGRYDALANPMYDHSYGTATLLPSGRVLVAGGLAGAAASEWDPDSASFVEIPEGMLAARGHHTATLLPSGRVLLAGGSHEGVPTASLELYVPSAGAGPGTFVDAGQMPEARSRHAAALLADGRVLIAGGLGQDTLSSSCLYVEDASGTGSIVPGPDLNVGRADHTATLTPGNEVLVTGGFGTTGVLSSSEAYDPSVGPSGVFSLGAEMSTARKEHTATLLASGEVLVLGGEQQPEVYGPSGTFKATAMLPSLVLPRYRHSATLMSNAGVLVVGGARDAVASQPSQNTDVFDPHLSGMVPGDAEVFPMYKAVDVGHSVTLLASGKVLVAGGADGASATATAVLFDPITGQETPVGPMHDARVAHTATLLGDGRVLIAGGCSADCITSTEMEPNLESAEIYDPGEGAAGSFVSLAPMNSARGAHRATLLANGKVLLSGGRSSPGMSTAAAELFDPSSGTFVPLPDMVAPRAAHTSTLLTDNRVLLVGGSGGNDSAEIFDPLANGGQGAFVLTGSLHVDRRLHAATLLADGRVLVTGGVSNSEPGPVSSAEVFDPRANASNGAFVNTHEMASTRAGHVSVLMADGRVWVAGGLAQGEQNTEVFDSFGDDGAGAFTEPVSLAHAHQLPAGLLLPDGRVMVVGGFTGTYLGRVEIVTPYAVAPTIPKPKITSAPPLLFAGQEAPVQGKGLRSAFSGSSGRHNDAASNIPIGVWMRMGGGGLVPVELRDFTDTSANARVTSAAIAGPGILVPVVNGIIGEGVITAVQPGPLGAECRSGPDCASGYCVEGVCCDGPCESTCWSCRSKRKGGGEEGVCGFVEAGVDPLDDCLDLGASTCSTDGVCDGTGACRVYEAGTPCGGGHLCPGHGTACPERCSGSDQCEQGYVCDPESQDCLLVSVECVDDQTLTTPDGPVDCRPYRCVADACLQACNSSALCLPGYTCDANQRCVPDAAVRGPVDDLGCGCETVGAPRPATSWAAWFAWTLALAVGWRHHQRRRRGPRTSSQLGADR